jgi:hypothetical protein
MTGSDVAEITRALGQPNGDYPGYEERVVLYGTNRARVSPTTEGWPAYPAQPPMQWNVDLNKSSRAHSTDMRDKGCFQHESCDGTAPFTRIQTFYKGAWMMMGENIAAGVPDPLTVVHNWIYEIGATAGETGHRDAIFSGSLSLIGVGFAAGGAGLFKNYWTQDFVGTPVMRPRLTDGIHFPKSPAAGGNVTFAASYYEANLTGQPSVFVVIDGSCKPLAMVRGTPALGAYESSVPVADGCHPYFFLATLGDGVSKATYPDTGALQVGAGAAVSTCLLFATTRTEATCAGRDGGVAGVGGTAGSAGAGGSSGAGGADGTAGSSGATTTGGRSGMGMGGVAGAAQGSGGADVGVGGTGGRSGLVDTGGAGGPGGAGGATGGPHGATASGGCDMVGAPRVDRASQAFALGLVLGWVARRRRLSLRGRDRGRRAVPGPILANNGGWTSDRL